MILHTEIANWCEDNVPMAVENVEIQTSVTYGRRAIGEPVRPGIVEVRATVGGTMIQLPRFPIDPFRDQEYFETAHPVLEDQRIRWRIITLSTSGIELVGFQRYGDDRRG